MNTSSPIHVIRSAPEYADRQQRLMEDVYGVTHLTDQVFSAAQFRHHAAIFPEGQFIAVEGEGESARVVGLTASMRFPFDPANPPIKPWWMTINNGWLHHDPNGEWMYGAESCVHPDYQGHGVGSMLMQARFDTARALNLRGMAAGSAIVSYHQVANKVSPEAYVQGVADGRYFDNNLTKQLKKGFRLGALIPNCITDASALGWGVWITWDNPDYDPSKTGKGVPTFISPQQYAVVVKSN